MLLQRAVSSEGAVGGGLRSPDAAKATSLRLPHRPLRLWTGRQGLLPREHKAGGVKVSATAQTGRALRNEAGREA